MDNQKLMGFVSPDDKKVPVPIRHWEGMKRRLWHSRVAWEIALKEAANLLGRCAHMEGCAAKTDETAQCLPDCPDRELRLSALVILSTARQFGPLDAIRAEGPYFAPSREHFSEVVAELGACQAELAALDPDGSKRRALIEATRTSTEPQPVATLAATESSQLKEAP